MGCTTHRPSMEPNHHGKLKQTGRRHVSRFVHPPSVFTNFSSVAVRHRFLYTSSSSSASVFVSLALAAENRLFSLVLLHFWIIVAGLAMAEAMEGSVDHLAGERATAQFDVQSMKVYLAGGEHEYAVSTKMAKLVAEDPVSLTPHLLLLLCSRKRRRFKNHN